MIYRTAIKQGNSLVVTIPAHTVNAWNIAAGDQLCLDRGPDRVLLIWPASQPIPPWIRTITAAMHAK